MRAMAHGEIGPVLGSRRHHARARSATDQAVTAAVILFLGAVLVAVVSGLSSERRAIRAMQPEQRVALLSRTVDELRQFCGPDRADPLKDHCRELASFASQFDECRGECEALVRRQLTPVPTR